MFASVSSGCTLYHSKQALSVGSSAPPRADATFITEEDSGLMIAGVITLTEPDHYAVLLERARRRHHCVRLSHAQLDFFTEFWIVVAFPITRMTLICERMPATTAPAPPAVPR
jgi:hypothetical protein